MFERHRTLEPRLIMTGKIDIQQIDGGVGPAEGTAVPAARNTPELRDRRIARCCAKRAGVGVALGVDEANLHLPKSA